MRNCWNCFQSLGLVTGGVIAFSINSAVAQITQDGTLTNNSRVIHQGNTFIIEDGTKVGNNLFHSFIEFSVPPENTAEFRNTNGVQNIISRVTGKSVSNIEGILKVNGVANLFLINPNGIIFGTNASLEINGSFVATTASSLNFADGTKFSATDPTTAPLLKVSVPVGLQFGATAAPIHNQSSHQIKLDGGSTSRTVGLQVPQGKTLALVGGEITLQGGSITAESGRIELGSVTGGSLVKLNQINQSVVLGYEGVQNFQNIRLMRPTANDFRTPSRLDVSGEGGGNIQIQGKTVELIGYPVLLTNGTTGNLNGGDITITASQLIVRDGAQIGTATIGKGAAGNLIVNASENVDIIGSFSSPNGFVYSSMLFSVTGAEGKAGDITINTRRLSVQDGGGITSGVSGLYVSPDFTKYKPATGKGGHLTVNASELVELVGSATSNATGLSAATLGPGDAGDVTVNTEKLIVRDGAAITVHSRFPAFTRKVTVIGDATQLGSAGGLNVNAGSVILDNKGTLSSESQLGKGGNIALKVRDLLFMRRESQISTNAGTQGSSGDGGNITIDARNGFIVAVPNENSDITANAFSGSGGKVTINATNILGFVPRTRADLVRLLNTQDTTQLNPNSLVTNDITAFSQQNSSLNGTVQINSPDADLSKGLVELPINVVDASRQIVASCNSSGRLARSSFIITGRGGIASSPIEPLTADAVLASWITLESSGENQAESLQNRRAISPEPKNTENASREVNLVNQPSQIVEAQGWVRDANGNVVLVAQAPTVTPNSPALTSAYCGVRS